MIEIKHHIFRVAAILTVCLSFAGAGVPRASAHDYLQHGPSTGHLLGSGGFGDIALVSIEHLTTTPGTVADLAISPDGQWAFVASSGEPSCAGPETGGQTSPDAGVWVIDISNLSDPTRVGFIASHQDTRPGEGLQVVNITTRAFSGNVLVMNNEQCGKNGKGGVSLWDVTNPRKPVRLSEHFGDHTNASRRDAHDIHSAFAWDAGDRAYVVTADSVDSLDVDILDITNPRRPRLIRELDLDATFPQILQVGLSLVEAFLHDVTVKQIDGTWVMLLSYWDAGFVQLDVDDPANPTLIGDTSYNNPDPELLESTGIALLPEGNAHQAEFTADNSYFIGVDEDLNPYGATHFEITEGAFVGTYPSVPVFGAAPIVTLADEVLDGPVVYGGYGCAASAAIPSPASIAGYEASLQAGEEKIIVLQRGPSGDPSAPEAGCFPGEKAHQAVLAGWDAVLFVQFHGGIENPPFCGSGGFVDAIAGVCTNHDVYHKLFNTVSLGSYPDGPTIGTVGSRIRVTAAFDGWGYVHLFSATPISGRFAELDTFAIPEGHDESFAIGFGDLSVHKVATHPVLASRAYLAYYSGGLRALEIQGEELVETGGYLDSSGNNFWGVEVFVRDGCTYVAASDRDSGLWLFKDTAACP